ncbi:MAG: hypothetical protein M1571_04620 [Firmicutes bacterium]|nr:hypothetical protein [Bacillota bacterium]
MERLLSTTIKVGVTIGNGSTADTCQVQNLRIQTGASPGEFASFALLGICCAKALVGNTLDAAVPVDASIPPNRVALVREFTLNSNVLRGAVKVEGVTNGVPVLQPHTEVVTEAVQVASRTVPANSTVSVALEIAHAGATNLPLAILCRTV